jgi:hypothetical protein
LEGDGGEAAWDLLLSEVWVAFMNRHRAELFTQDEDSEPEVEEELVRGDERTGPRFLVATFCRHNLHPGDPCVEDACPPCLMRRCVDSLKRIAHVRNPLGGPKAELIELDIYRTVRKMWRVEKTRWANMINTRGMLADMERNWEARALQAGSSMLYDMDRCKTCIDALEIARECPFLEEGWDVSFLPKPTVRSRRTPGVDSGQQRVGDASTQRLPHSPPYSPETAKAELPRELVTQCDGAQDTLFDDWRSRPDKEDESIAFALNDNARRPPSPSASPEPIPSSIYAHSPPPPLSPGSSDSSNTECKRVTFADDVIGLPRRKSTEYHRNAPTYHKGRYAAPPGSEWQDTSFMENRLYNFWGVAEGDETELEKLIIARAESLEKDSNVEGGVLEHEVVDWDEILEEVDADIELDRLEKERDDNFGVDFDLFKEGEDDDFSDMVTESGRKKSRPLFRFQRRQQASVVVDTNEDIWEEDGKLPDTHEPSPAPDTSTTVIADDNDSDNEQKLGAIPLVGQSPRRRRNHDEFEEDGKSEDDVKSKKQCQWARFMKANGVGL